jgi:hypothetical protein
MNQRGSAPHVFVFQVRHANHRAAAHLAALTDDRQETIHLPGRAFS